MCKTRWPKPLSAYYHVHIVLAKDHLMPKVDFLDSPKRNRHFCLSTTTPVSRSSAGAFLVTDCQNRCREGGGDACVWLRSCKRRWNLLTVEGKQEEQPLLYGEECEGNVARNCPDSSADFAREIVKERDRPPRGEALAIERSQSEYPPDI